MVSPALKIANSRYQYYRNGREVYGRFVFYNGKVWVDD